MAYSRIQTPVLLEKVNSGAKAINVEVEHTKALDHFWKASHFLSHVLVHVQ